MTALNFNKRDNINEPAARGGADLARPQWEKIAPDPSYPSRHVEAGPIGSRSARHASSDRIRIARGRLPPSLLPYAPIAATALMVHILCLWLCGGLFDLGLSVAQAIAGTAGCIATYCIKEMVSYRRRGPWRWYLGLIPFLASCTLGLLASVLLAVWLAQLGLDLLTAGGWAALLGLWWNYGAVDRHGWAGW